MTEQITIAVIGIIYLLGFLVHKGIIDESSGDDMRLADWFIVSVWPLFIVFFVLFVVPALFVELGRDWHRKHTIKKEG